MDAHLARMDVHLARTNELFDQQRRELQDIRFEQRQMTLRGERVAQGFVAVLQEMRDDIRAQTRCLLAVLDRIDDGRGGATAGA